MQVEALLCDAATVREGLLHVLGGGITRIWRPQFPAPLNVDLALVLTLVPAEAQERHRLRVLVLTADGTQLAETRAEFGLGALPPNLQPGERLIAPVVLPLRPVQLPGPGTYSVEVLIDGQLQRSFTFVAAPPPAGPGQALTPPPT